MKHSKQYGDQPGFETDAEDTYSVRPHQIVKRRRRRTLKFLRNLQKLRAISNYIKIIRFQSKDKKKTYRVYCYEEESMGFPRRFTKKMNAMVSDNDRQSDEQLIEEDKRKCLASLFEAIAERNKIRGQAD